MPRPPGRAWLLASSATALAALIAGSTTLAAVPAGAATGTTAWRNGTFVVDTPNLVRRSDIVLGTANRNPSQFIPLGNGTLGVAAWAANGFTAQLNRTDTFPDRKSPGQLVIPGLAALTGPRPRGSTCGAGDPRPPRRRTAWLSSPKPGRTPTVPARPAVRSAPWPR
ncbi:MAG: hypothetical protein AUI14_15075 [Actinobacteria bacterium 13_2_20CM_2_71_6]|nr:MAG: hypothetical protein AUI14_15075 [Actinobacteria bacterium 13_2_20CM_2_71_6]